MTSTAAAPVIVGLPAWRQRGRQVAARFCSKNCLRGDYLSAQIVNQLR